MSTVSVQAPAAGRRRWLVIACGAVFFLLLAVGGGVWYLMRPGLAAIHPQLPVAVGVAGLSGLLLLPAAVLAIVAGLAGVGLPVRLRLAAWRVLLWTFPLLVGVGRLIGTGKEEIERSFIAVSNSLLRHRNGRIPGDRIMVMLPHCLQLGECPHKITQNPGNCRQCGQCDIGRLISLAETYRVNVQVVTGGTLARRLIRQLRPLLVIAVACERDLSSGIKDVFPLPALGILNIRPQGPCLNTRVDVAAVERLLEEVVDRGRE
ncbi:MAG: DUF116 domain-containing protein [Negativicutes bacterium]|nr:DUF116 domain-containing protein [Negativicutes bacterium]